MDKATCYLLSLIAHVYQVWPGQPKSDFLNIFQRSLNASNYPVIHKTSRNVLFSVLMIILRLLRFTPCRGPDPQFGNYCVKPCALFRGWRAPERLQCYFRKWSTKLIIQQTQITIYLFWASSVVSLLTISPVPCHTRLWIDADMTSCTTIKTLVNTVRKWWFPKQNCTIMFNKNVFFFSGKLCCDIKHCFK